MISFQIAETILKSIDPSLIDGDPLIKAANLALELNPDAKQGDLTILLTDDAQVQELNRQYMEIDAPTDVLSFPADYMDPDTNSPYLGDVIISYPRAQEQATNGGHSIEHELQLLVVHGILHLSGHDHLEEIEKNRMWSLQNEVLKKLDNPLSPP